MKKTTHIKYDRTCCEFPVLPELFLLRYTRSYRYAVWRDAVRGLHVLVSKLA